MIPYPSSRALVFTVGLAILAAAYYWTNVSRVPLFWAAFILTRPLEATADDFLDKPVNHGGLALSRPLASAVIAAVIVICVAIVPQTPRHASGYGIVAGAHDWMPLAGWDMRREHRDLPRFRRGIFVLAAPLTTAAITLS